MGGFAINPNISLLIIAILNMITAFLAFKTHQLTKQVEVATNSMKDALVVSTAKASFAAGETKARKAGEEKAETLLKKS